MSTWQERSARHARHDRFVTISEHVAIVLLPIAAVLSLRKAPLPSSALLLAFIANLGYLHETEHPTERVAIMGMPIAEFIRWISALVGACGAYEFGKGVERMKRRRPVSIPDALRKVNAAAWIGLVLLASMGVDGFGMIAFRAFDVWIVPEATIGILLSVALLGIFGKDKP